MAARRRTVNSWSNREIKRLKQIYPSLTVAELKLAFPNRTFNSVMSMAGQHKLRKQKVHKLSDFWRKVIDAHVYARYDFPSKAGDGWGTA